jgi:hypothetical protein
MNRGVRAGLAIAGAVFGGPDGDLLVEPRPPIEMIAEPAPTAGISVAPSPRAPQAVSSVTSLAGAPDPGWAGTTGATPAGEGGSAPTARPQHTAKPDSPVGRTNARLAADPEWAHPLRQLERRLGRPLLDLTTYTDWELHGIVEALLSEKHRRAKRWYEV